jgi:hypothetical protein
MRFVHLVKQVFLQLFNADILNLLLVQVLRNRKETFNVMYLARKKDNVVIMIHAKMFVIKIALPAKNC